MEDRGGSPPPDAVDKLRAMLTFLQDLKDPETLSVFPLWKAHQLTGKRKCVWSLHVARNWRLTSQIEDGEIWDLDYEAPRMLNPVHPGSFLKSEIIEAHGLPVTEAAKILRVSRPTLSSFLNAKAESFG